MNRRNRRHSFRNAPSVAKHRSRFDLSSHHKTSMNVGTLVPFYVQEVYPGDTFKVHAVQVNRVTSAWVKVPMDNLFVDTYYFFVPNRIVFDNWEEVMGENKETAWTQPQEFSVPMISPFSADTGVVKGSIADYMGIPSNMSNLPPVNILPFRAFALIYNEWFRDQNIEDPVFINKTATIGDASLNADEWSPDNIFGMPPKINKLHDYFTSCLPSPQKGNPVEIPLIGNAPVVANSSRHSVTSGVPMTTADAEGGVAVATGYHPMYAQHTNAGSGLATVRTDNTTVTPLGLIDSPVFDNLYADLTGVSSTNVNDLRFAFQLQKMFERDARGGTRYTEIMQSHFGVYSPDSRLQRPEYLGGNRQPINITQVAQTSSSDNTSPQANVSGYSLSQGRSGFTKAFVEHGFVIGVSCIRQKHTYQQGIEKFWFRSGRLDYYDPVFANLGEQPVYSKEIYASAPQNSVFGYNEAWADLRYRPDRVSGILRSTLPTSLDIWHFGDYYATPPFLVPSWLQESPDFVDRCLAVPSTEEDQFIFDIYINNTAIRTMPTYSIPGFIDHN